MNISAVKSPAGPISTGHGEYLVFREGEEKTVSQETFEKAYKILRDYTPAAMIKKGLGEDVYLNRHSLIQQKIANIDPSLKIAFIPRTLYELIYIRKAIKEDMKAEEICPRLGLIWPDEDRIEKADEILKDKKCWHLAQFGDDSYTGASDEQNQHQGVKEIAYRLNNVAVKALKPTSKGFTLKELQNFTKKEILFLNEHHKTYPQKKEDIDKRHRGKKKEFLLGIQRRSIFNNAAPGPTTNFGWDIARCQVKPLGVRNEQDKNIILNAVSVECSEVAKRCFLLYRGTEYDVKEENIDFHTLSYGVSLFAGSVHDGGATAFRYMRDQTGYVMPVPFEELNNPVVHIPTTGPIVQLLSHGELFHARTKVPRLNSPSRQWNIREYGGNTDILSEERDLEHLRSEEGYTEMEKAFKEYKKKSILLTPPHEEPVLDKFGEF